MHHQDTRKQSKVAAGNRGQDCRRTVSALIAVLTYLAMFLAVTPLHGQTPASTLNLLISLKQPFVAEPEAARIVLHLHNPSAQAVWLYRRARGKHPPEEVSLDENQPARSTGRRQI